MVFQYSPFTDKLTFIANLLLTIGFALATTNHVVLKLGFSDLPQVDTFYISGSGFFLELFNPPFPLVVYMVRGCPLISRLLLSLRGIRKLRIICKTTYLLKE